MVTLKKLTLHHLFGIDHVEASLDMQGLVVVQGKNGSGKSSIFIEGIFYMLYGQSVIYGKSPGSSVVNRHKGKKGYGIITLDVDGVEYTIIRCRGSWKPKSIGLDPGIKLSPVTLLCQGSDITEVKNPQKAITSILGMSPDTFKASVMFPAAIKRFSSMADSDRKAVLDDLLETSILDNAHDLTKGRVIAAEERMRQCDQSLEKQQAAKEALQQELSQVLAAKDRWEDENRQKINALIREAQELSVKIKSQREERDRREDAITHLRQEFAKAEDEWKTQFEECRGEEARLRQVMWDVDLVRNTHKALTLQKQKDVHRVDKLIEQKKCPTCGGDTNILSGEHQVKHAELDGMIKQLEKMDEEYNRAALDLSGYQSATRDAISALEMCKEDAHDALSEAERSLRELSASVDNSVRDAKAKVAMARSLEAAQNPYQDSDSRLKNTLDAMQRKEHDLREQRKKLAADLGDEKVLYSVFGTKGARLAMFSQAIPMLNLEAKKVADIMGTNICVTFALRGDDESWSGSLQLDVNNPSGAESYQGQSQGEKRRIDLIIIISLLRLAISRGARSFCQVFFDEAFESVDPSGEEAIMQVLRSIEREHRCSSIFAINHNSDRIAAMADAVWTVDNGSLTIP